MEPSKFEKQFREKLNSREIKPSEMAWSKLDTMLSIAEKTKNKPKLNWMYFAASFIGFIFIGTVFFNTSETKKIEPNESVVIRQEEELISPERSGIIEEKTTVLNPIKNTSTEKQVAIVNNNLKTQPNQLKNTEYSIINQPNKNDAIVNSSENKTYQSISNNKYVSAEKLLAEVSNTNFETKVNDNRIEINRKVISVNPNSLLSKAETELNQSFRESALDRLNKNFNSIKTVLVNRNYEE